MIGYPKCGLQFSYFEIDRHSKNKRYIKYSEVSSDFLNKLKSGKNKISVNIDQLKLHIGH